MWSSVGLLEGGLRGIIKCLDGFKQGGCPSITSLIQWPRLIVASLPGPPPRICIIAIEGCTNRISGFTKAYLAKSRKYFIWDISNPITRILYYGCGEGRSKIITIHCYQYDQHYQHCNASYVVDTTTTTTINMNENTTTITTSYTSSKIKCKLLQKT